MTSSRNYPTLTHVLYVDDILVFYRKTKRNLSSLMDLFQSYGNVSDQIINPNKCLLFSSSMTPYIMLEIESLLGFKVGNLSFSYLGVPIFVGFHNKPTDFHSAFIQISVSITLAGMLSKGFLSYSMLEFSFLKSFDVDIHPPKPHLIKRVDCCPPLAGTIKCNEDGLAKGVGHTSMMSSLPLSWTLRLPLSRPSKSSLSLGDLVFVVSISMRNSNIVSIARPCGMLCVDTVEVFLFSMSCDGTVLREGVEEVRMAWNMVLRGWKGVFTMMERMGKMGFRLDGEGWFSQELPALGCCFGAMESAVVVDLKVGMCEGEGENLNGVRVNENDWNVAKRGWDAQVLGEAPYKFTNALEAITKLRAEPKANNQYLPPFDRTSGEYFVYNGIQTFACRFFLQKAVASGGSNLARLGELGGKLLPYFAINRGRSEGRRGSAFLTLLILSKLLRKIISVKKIEAEALP
ncbi:2,3-bisphosphoglycerate-independent phosphoglycerate mutase [Glycine soja]|uniref:2,3-bisphosphoglycerate-independent phosphoglycerate mutase n=1 Tax=Glycine soja TaxID=3848 RepID=A0A445KLG5_GLYSO|nr:2,3-bisphosphoglycerate-independent phosphoglycerate mutase [Glycine soja]